MEVKFIKPTDELIQAIAADMRQADVDEIWASNHYTPIDGLMESWKVSDYSAVVVINNEPCVMVGLVIANILGGVGVPWLMGSNAIMKYKSSFMRYGPELIEQMLDVCPKLVNYVHVKNKASVRWLKQVGFKFDDPVPYGAEQELFHRFHLQRAA